jgi:ABC-type transporter Mla subunit MlaD
MTTSHWGLANAHQEVVEAVRAVVEKTEAPILTAGRTVSLLVERAQSTLKETENLTGHDAAGRSDLSRLLLAQSEATRNYIEAFAGCLKEVASVTTRATALMGTITSAATNFAQLVRMGDFLSLYAKMELARLPPGISESSSFSEEFKSLTRDIRDLSERIGRFAETMIASLPAIDGLVHELAVESRSVAGQVETQTLRVGGVGDALDQSLRVLSRLGEERLPSIVERAQKSLSLLQFYDPLIQSMQSLDGLMAELRSAANGDGGAVQTLRYALRLGDVEVSKGNQSGSLTSQAPVAEAGKVVMF